MSARESPTAHQIECIARMRRAGRLVWKWGFWTVETLGWAGPSRGQGSPGWSADHMTIKAMARRGWIEKEGGATDYKAPWILTARAPEVAS